MDDDGYLPVRRVPSLNIPNSEPSPSSIDRRVSESDIEDNTERTYFRLLLDEYKNITKEVNEIKETVSILKECILFEELNIGSEIKNIRKDLYSLVVDFSKTPRMLSRCDAAVGNTQMLINRFEKMRKEMTDDKNIMNNMNNLQNSINTIIKRLNRIDRKTKRIEYAMRKAAGLDNESSSSDSD